MAGSYAIRGIRGANTKVDPLQPCQFEGGNGVPGIRVKEGESFESALRRFKKKCEKAGILADLRRHQHFEKPSERRKRKLNAAKRKNNARRLEN